MLLIKQITLLNYWQFYGMEANVIVVEHKEGEFKMRHHFYMVGIIVSEFDDSKGRYFFYLKFSNGNTGAIYNSILELILKESKYFSFYYIEIKKQS